MAIGPSLLDTTAPWAGQYGGLSGGGSGWRSRLQRVRKELGTGFKASQFGKDFRGLRATRMADRLAGRDFKGNFQSSLDLLISKYDAAKSVPPTAVGASAATDLLAKKKPL